MTRLLWRGLLTEWLLTAPDCTRQHRAGNDWLFHFDDKLKGVRRANYPQLTKEMNPSRHSWWVGDGRRLFNVSCLFSWSPSTVGSLLCLNSTGNSRRSEIISHFRPGTGPVRSGSVNSHSWLLTHLQMCARLSVCARTYEYRAMGKMRNCGMQKVKCGLKNAEWRWLVEATNHVTAGFPQITTPVSQPAVR